MSMLCGKEAHRCAAWSNHWIIFPEQTTWPAHFAAHGYATALVGKMHFGGKDQMQGFQSRPYGDLRHGLGHQPDPLHMFPGYSGFESAGVTEIPESLLQDVVVTRESLAWLLEQHDREPESPWLLCASYSRPHEPLTAPGRYIRRYRGKVPSPPVRRDDVDQLETFARRLVFDLTEEQIPLQRGRQGYYACVDFVDDCIGELVDGLEQATLLDNTIVIYTSDHGEMLGNYGCSGEQFYYESSIGVPLLISGPRIAAGQTVQHPISLMDLFPTTCGLAGLPIPEGLDGFDFSHILHDPQKATAPREISPIATYRYGIRIAEGQTDDDTPCSAWRCVRERDWKYVEVEKGDALLFDLVNDPQERTNLASVEEHRPRCEAMRAKMYANFSWERAHRQLEQDRERFPELFSGL